MTTKPEKLKLPESEAPGLYSVLKGFSPSLNLAFMSPKRWKLSSVFLNLRFFALLR